METDEMELDTIGDRKTALFVIISDTDDTFNFVVSILYTQLFNLLCDKADDEYGGRLPVHVMTSGMTPSSLLLWLPPHVSLSAFCTSNRCFQIHPSLLRLVHSSQRKPRNMRVKRPAYFQYRMI